MIQLHQFNSSFLKLFLSSKEIFHFLVFSSNVLLFHQALNLNYPILTLRMQSYRLMILKFLLNCCCIFNELILTEIYWWCSPLCVFKSEIKGFQFNPKISVKLNFLSNLTLCIFMKSILLWFKIEDRYEILKVLHFQSTWR